MCSKVRNKFIWIGYEDAWGHLTKRILKLENWQARLKTCMIIVWLVGLSCGDDLYKNKE